MKTENFFATAENSSFSVNTKVFFQPADKFILRFKGIKELSVKNFVNCSQTLATRTMGWNNSSVLRLVLTSGFENGGDKIIY
jgi:hypothetical protein